MPEGAHGSTNPRGRAPAENHQAVEPDVLPAMSSKKSKTA